MLAPEGGLRRWGFGGEVPSPGFFFHRGIPMAKSREEVMASLKSIFNNNGKAEKPGASAKQAAQPPVSPKSSMVGKFRRIADKAAEVEEQEEEEVEDEEVEETTEEQETEESGEVLPGLLDRVEALIDFVVENEESLREFLTAARS